MIDTKGCIVNQLYLVDIETTDSTGESSGETVTNLICKFCENGTFQELNTHEIHGSNVIKIKPFIAGKKSQRRMPR